MGRLRNWDVHGIAATFASQPSWTRRDDTGRLAIIQKVPITLGTWTAWTTWTALFFQKKEFN
jgi:hypothetical protein